MNEKDIVEILNKFGSIDILSQQFEEVAKAIMDKIREEEYKRKYITKDEIEFQNFVDNLYKE